MKQQQCATMDENWATQGEKMATFLYEQWLVMEMKYYSNDHIWK